MENTYMNQQQQQLEYDPLVLVQPNSEGQYQQINLEETNIRDYDPLSPEKTWTQQYQLENQVNGLAHKQQEEWKSERNQFNGNEEYQQWNMETNLGSSLNPNHELSSNPNGLGRFGNDQNQQQQRYDHSNAYQSNGHPISNNSQQQDIVKKLQSRLQSFLDHNNGIINAHQGMGRLVDAMKGETSLEAKLYELTVLANTTNQESLDEFLHKGGIAILCQWAKEIKADNSTRDSTQWNIRKDTFKQMVFALDKLPITWNLLKKTKIGKAINSILKAQMFDAVTNEVTANLVNRWKKMVKDHKYQESELQEQNLKKQANKQEKPEQNYNNQNPEKQSAMQKTMNLPSKRSHPYDQLYLTEEQDLKRRKLNEWGAIDHLFQASATSTDNSSKDNTNLLKSLISGKPAPLPANTNSQQHPPTNQQNQAKQPSSPPQNVYRQTSSKRKSVAWQTEDKMEQIKFFKMNDEPNAPGLSFDEVAEIQRHLANVPSHMIPTELKNIEMKLDRQKLEEQKNKEQYIKDKLEKMQPLISYRNPQLYTVDLGPNYKQSKGEMSKEEQNQKQREKTVFQLVYLNAMQIPQNPLKELDELYAKDEKIQQIDLEQIAQDHLKEEDEKRFQDELVLITNELQQLDEVQRNQILAMIAAGSDHNNNQAASMSHDMTIQLIKKLITDFKLQNEAKKAAQPQKPLGPQPINPKNYRTVPCRLYHGPTGCTRGDFCHFIHAIGFEQREMPREVFMKYRNENMRKNYLDEITAIDSQAGNALQTATFQQIQQYVKSYNDSLVGGGAPQPQMQTQMQTQMPNQMNPMRPQMGMQNPQVQPQMNNNNNNMGVRLPPNNMMNQPPIYNQQPNIGQQQFRAPMNQMMNMPHQNQVQQRPPLLSQMDQMPQQLNPNPMMNPMMQMNPNMMNPNMISQMMAQQQQNIRMPNAMMMNQMMYRPPNQGGGMYIPQQQQQHPQHGGQPQQQQNQS